MNTYTFTTTRTSSRILFLIIQVRSLLRRTSAVSDKGLESINYGIERRWIQGISLFAIDKSNICKAQVVLTIEWDDYDVQRFSSKYTISFDDALSPSIPNHIEIDEIVALFNEFVSAKSLITKCNVTFGPNIDNEKIKSLEMSPAEPIKWGFDETQNITKAWLPQSKAEPIVGTDHYEN